jgi:hypothetical protein
MQEACNRTLLAAAGPEHQNWGERPAGVTGPIPGAPSGHRRLTADGPLPQQTSLEHCGGSSVT